MVRPASTDELFSQTPLATPDKENQRLKPRCDLRIFHSLDPSGKDLSTLDGNPIFTGATAPLKVLQRIGGKLELELAPWFSQDAWPSRVWIETNQTNISFVLMKNAEVLRGDLSLATRLNIEVAGVFTTKVPLKKASLMSLGRVVSTS